MAQRSSELTIIGDSTERQADRILDDPGLPTFDPDDAWEYLDGIPDMSVTGIELLHANPNVSWISTHRAIMVAKDTTKLIPSSKPPDSAAQPSTPSDNYRNDRSYSSNKNFSLRSRVGESLEAYSQEGYITNKYLGPPEVVYNRIRAQSPAIGVSGLEEKLAGESSYTDRLYGFANLRKPIEIGNTLSIKQALAGDYTLAFGNGMIFGGGISSPKTIAAAIAGEQRSFGARGTVSNGATSLQGAEIELGVGLANLMLFASNRAIDAKVNARDSIQTLSPSASHQTESELALEDAASSTVIGARVEVKTNDTASIFVKGGATAYELRYDHPLSTTAKQFFTGSTLSMAGVDALVIGGNFSATVDAAISKHDTVRNAGAFSVSTLFEADSNIGLSLMYRHIPNGFVSPFGKISGGAISSLSNADGFYIGVQLSALSKRLRISAYANIENQMASISNVFEKQKNDYLASFRYKATNALELSATVRDNWNSNPPQDSTLTGTQNAYGQTTNIRFEATYDPKQSASLKTRYEFVRNVTGDSAKTGWLALEEIKFRIKPIHAELVVSAGRFQTDSYNSSVWLYEPSVWGTGTNNALDIKGWRVDVRTVLHAWKSFACSFNFSGSIYDSPRTIGSGVSARTGTDDLNAAIQLDFGI